MNRLEKLPKPVLFAHRGSSAHAPENTIAAFELAVAQGADAIELDVKLSADNEAIVIHDPTLDRTTNGCGLVSKYTLSEILKLDAGSWFSSDFKGEPVPSLAKVFQQLDHRIFINVELTNYSTPFDALPVIVAKLVRQYEQQDNVLFSSFNFLSLLRIRRLLPQMPIAILASSGISGLIARSIIGRLVSPKNIHPHLKDISPSFLRKEFHHGRRIHVWTVNDPQSIQNLKSFGVDGIFTDDPLLATSLWGRI